MADPRSVVEEQILGGTTSRRGDAVFVRGRGCWMFDSDGQRYLDLSSAQGVAMLGHCHPSVTAAVARQAGTLMLCPNYLYNDVRAEFADALAQVLPLICRTFSLPTAAPKPWTARSSSRGC